MTKHSYRNPTNFINMTPYREDSFMAIEKFKKKIINSARNELKKAKVIERVKARITRNIIDEIKNDKSNVHPGMTYLKISDILFGKADSGEKDISIYAAIVFCNENNCNIKYNDESQNRIKDDMKKFLDEGYTRFVSLTNILRESVMDQENNFSSHSGGRKRNHTKKRRHIKRRKSRRI